VSVNNDDDEFAFESMLNNMELISPERCRTHSLSADWIHDLVLNHSYTGEPIYKREIFADPSFD
jgi:hypothetical protein